MKPADVRLGRVESLKPLKISLGGAVSLGETFFIFTGDAKENLKQGDKLALVQALGGQRFLVVGVVK